MGKPILPDIKLLLQAGFKLEDVKGLKRALALMKQPVNPDLKPNARRLFRIIDEQRAVNRYKWYNLPEGLSSQELERLLYYRYSLCFFYWEKTGQFYFLPYALNGTIDMYARFNHVTPVPFAEQEDYKKTAEYKGKVKMLQELKLKVIKDVVVDLSEINYEMLTNSCVLLRDYTNQLGQKEIARWTLHEHLLDLQADTLCFLRTNLILATGIQGLKVPDADAASEADSIGAQFYTAAVTGNPYVAVTGTVQKDFQELQPNSTTKASEYFLAMQSIDNMLLSAYGIENSGLFNKKAHTLESENAVNATNVSLVMQDGLSQRQHFCNIVNSIWNLGLWCEISENVVGADTNGDGVAYDESDPETDSGVPGASEEGGGE